MTPNPRNRCILSEIAAIQTGPFGTQLHASDYKSNGTPIITVEHLGDNEVLHQNLPLVGDADRRRLATYDLRTGDIVFTRVGAIDRRAYVSERENGWLFSGRLLRIRSAHEAVDGKFLSYVLGHHDTVQWIRNHAVGSTMACLNTHILSGIPLSLPPRREQHLVSKILDSLSQAIFKTEQLVAKRKQMKQGLLHDLLTRGIDENGELRDAGRHPERFANSSLGKIPQAWELSTCEQICREIVVGIVIRPSRYYRETGIPVLRSANVREHGLVLEDLQHMSLADHRANAKSAVAPGDLVTVRSGYPGTTAVIPDSLSNANCVDIIVSRAGPRVLPDYLAAWLNSDMGKGMVLRRQGGLAQQHFNVGEMKELAVPLPPIAEQARIVQLQSAFSEHLFAEEAYVAKLRLLKQGLMDDLLTGRVRVTPLLPEPAP